MSNPEILSTSSVNFPRSCFFVSSFSDLMSEREIFEFSVELYRTFLETCVVLGMYRYAADT